MPQNAQSQTPSWVANAGDPFMEPGIAAVTCTVPQSVPASTAFTLAFFDLRNPPGALYNSNLFTSPAWNAPVYHHPDWTVEKIGNVYGLAIDGDGDVYTTAHGLYGMYYGYPTAYGSIGGGATSTLAAGTVYKISRLTGVPTVFSVIPGQVNFAFQPSHVVAPGLGNIAYDAKNDQFFVTSLEDGKIYRIGASGGPPIDSFDPMAPDNGAPGLPPKEERLWGIGVLDDKVYYAVWNTGDSTDPGEIRSIDLTGSGGFDTTSDASVLSVPPSTMSFAKFVPVADITFSKDGTTMLLGERTMILEYNGYNHASRVHWVEFVSGNWVVQRTLEPGGNPVTYSQGEAYGGVAYGEDGGIDEQVIWMSSADTSANSGFTNSFGPHGLFGVRPSLFPVGPAEVTDAFRVPYDPTSNGNGPDLKGSGGDIEIMQRASCARFEVGEIECPEMPGDPYTFDVTITNNSTATAHFARFTQCPSDELPDDAVTIPPSPPVITFPTPIAIGDSDTIPLSILAPASGGKNCFLITLLDETGNVCCTEKLCLDLPRCDCAELVDHEITCELQADGTIKYTIILTVRNRTNFSSSPYPFRHATILPPAGFDSAAITPNPDPILPGGTGTLTTCYYGSPGPLKFTLSLHNETLEECCSIEDICLELPDCPPGGGKPDECEVDRRVPCCPPDETATITYTIINNSTSTRTYNWTARGVDKPGCDRTLTAANFITNSGTTPSVPPGGTATITVTVRCDDFEPLDCAGFEICTTYNPDVPPLCCCGVVYRPDPDDGTVKTDPAGGMGIPTVPPGSATTLSYRLSNPTNTDFVGFVTLMELRGELAFSPGGGEIPVRFLSIPVKVPARGESVLRVVATQVGDGFGTRFGNIVHWIGPESTADPVGLDLESINLISAVLLTDRDPAFAIRGLRIDISGPLPQIEMLIPTIAGCRYRIQESADLKNPWQNSPCTVSDTTVDEDGVFLGTGSDVRCSVPCNPGDRRKFFRAVQLE